MRTLAGVSLVCFAIVGLSECRSSEGTVRVPSDRPYRPMPTTQRSTIKLNGTPNNHIMTYGILSPSIYYRESSMQHLLLGGTDTRTFDLVIFEPTIAQ